VKIKDKKIYQKLRKFHLFIYFYLVLILLVITTVSTYAWFSLTRTPRVSNLSVYVNAYPGMELSLSPESDQWLQQISYEDMFKDNYELRPATWSDKDQMFYGATYSASGRLQTDKWEPLTDERHSNHTNRENHYCVGSFYARSGSKVMVSLDTARVLDDGRATSGTYLFGEPSWNEETISHDNKGMGAENAIRIGIKVTRLNSDLTPSDKPTEFFIYEPNGDAHNDGTAGYVDTPSVDGTSTLIPEERIIKQGASSWSESDPVEKNVIVHRLGDFDGSTDMFIIDIDEIVQIQIYIWLEGQDVDCTNEISEARVVANLQFKSTVIGDSGLVPIPKEEE
jgi:hypothetical protein